MHMYIRRYSVWAKYKVGNDTEEAELGIESVLNFNQKYVS